MKANEINSMRDVFASVRKCSFSTGAFRCDVFAVGVPIGRTYRAPANTSERVEMEGRKIFSFVQPVLTTTATPGTTIRRVVRQ